MSITWILPLLFFFNASDIFGIKKKDVMKSKMNVSQNIYALLVMMTLIVYVLVFVLFYRMFIARKKSKDMSNDI